MSTTEHSNASTSTSDLQEQIHGLKEQIAVQAAEQVGAQSTQAAAQAGDTAAQTATHAGTWSTMIAGAAMFIVGIFMALAFVAVAKD